MEEGKNKTGKKQTSRRTDSVDKIVGQSLRRFRKEVGWTQKQLGDAIGMSFKQVRKYEIAENRISASALYAVSVALGKKIDDFYDFRPLDVEAEDHDLTELEAGQRFEHESEIPAANEISTREIMINLPATASSRDEILGLVEKYYGIKDKKQRQVFLELVRSIATEFS